MFQNQSRVQSHVKAGRRCHTSPLAGACVLLLPYPNPNPKTTSDQRKRGVSFEIGHSVSMFFQNKVSIKQVCVIPVTCTQSPSDRQKHQSSVAFW